MMQGVWGFKYFIKILYEHFVRNACGDNCWGLFRIDEGVVAYLPDMGRLRHIGQIDTQGESSPLQKKINGDFGGRKFEMRVFFCLIYV